MHDWHQTHGGCQNSNKVRTSLTSRSLSMWVMHLEWVGKLNSKDCPQMELYHGTYMHFGLCCRSKPMDIKSSKHKSYFVHGWSWQRSSMGGTTAPAYPDDSFSANSGSQTNNGILHVALFQEGTVTDDGISNLGAHNLGRGQEPWGCVDGGLRVIELKLGWLHSNSPCERQPMSLCFKMCIQTRMGALMDYAGIG